MFSLTYQIQGSHIRWEMLDSVIINALFCYQVLKF